LSGTSQGPGWWIASDGRWYPPQFHLDLAAPPWTGSWVDPIDRPAGSLASWAPAAARPMEAPPVVAYPSRAGDADHQGFKAAWGSPPPSSVPSFPATHPLPPNSSGGRFGRGLRLVGIGFTMAKDEPGLMMVPIVACVLQLAIVGAGALLILPGLRAVDASTEEGPTCQPANGW
jgi:hypothetical protein